MFLRIILKTFIVIFGIALGIHLVKIQLNNTSNVLLSSYNSINNLQNVRYDNNILSQQSHAFYIQTIKKYINQHHKQLQNIILPIIDTIEKLIPEGWISAIGGALYFIFTLTFGGGFSYFNQNIKQLNNHKAKIQRGVDLANQYNQKSEKLINNFQRTITYQQFQQHFPKFKQIDHYLKNNNKSIKILESEGRQDVSKLVNCWLKHNQKAHGISYNYLNLRVPPSNGETTSTYHITILEDIVFSELFIEDRSTNLMIFKQSIKFLKSIYTFLVRLIMKDWITSGTLLNLALLILIFLMHSSLGTFMAVYLIALKIYEASQERNQSKSSKGKYLVIDQFHLSAREINLPEAVNEENARNFRSILKNMVNLAFNNNIQIVLICDNKLFIQDYIKRYAPAGDQRIFESKKVESIKLQNQKYISYYLGLEQDYLEDILLWTNRLQEISIFKNHEEFAKKQLLLQYIFSIVIQRHLSQIRTLIYLNQSRSTDLDNIIQKSIQEALSLSQRLKETQNQRNEDLITIKYYESYLNRFLSKLYPSLSTSKRQSHAANIPRLMIYYPEYYSTRLACSNSRRKLSIEDLKSYQQCINILNREHLFHGQFFDSKSVCLSMYFYILSK